MIVLGIDEAGYGPMLGPLVVAGSAFRVAGAETIEDVGPRLKKALRKAKVVVGDSKQVYGGTRDLATLERPVLAFLSMLPACDTSRFDGVLTGVQVDPGVRRLAPWYSGDLRSYPCSASAIDVAEATDRLRAALAAAGIEFVGFAAQVVPETLFNASLVSGNKADALFELAASVFDGLAAHRVSGESLSAVFDRQGGRHYYAASLQRRWPASLVSPLAETADCSDYRVHFASGHASLRFQVEADGTAPHVGLASMLAKYLREVFMSLFNAHFAPLCPGIAPTAGYVEDARRWLSETRAARASAGVADGDLVRLR